MHYEPTTIVRVAADISGPPLIESELLAPGRFIVRRGQVKANGTNFTMAGKGLRVMITAHGTRRRSMTLFYVMVSSGILTLLQPQIMVG